MTTTIDLVFRNMAEETLRRLREFRADEPSAPDRTVAILTATLREAFNAGKLPTSEGLNHSRLETLRSVLRVSREKAAAKRDAAPTDAERLFESGLVEAYRFIELTIEKLERGDFT